MEATSNESNELDFNCSIICNNETYCRNLTCSMNTTTYRQLWVILISVMYSLVFCVGIIGNGLVIFVVLRYAKMRSVTNMYIFNLAVSDFCFIIGLPFLIVTAIQQTWIFGHAMCKVFYILTSLNWYTSIFNLTVMSADRYLAICHPISSIRIRTTNVSTVVCIAVWIVSMLAMLPIFLYAGTVHSNGTTSCTIEWSKGQLIDSDRAFVWYTFFIGFAIPVTLISIFYLLVILRLRTTGLRQKKRKQSHKKVTRLVVTIVVVYVFCWLPYWIYQIVVVAADLLTVFHPWLRYLFQVIMTLGYSNSMLNPLLYAFLSENFRKTFVKLINCSRKTELEPEHIALTANKTIDHI